MFGGSNPKAGRTERPHCVFHDFGPEDDSGERFRGAGAGPTQNAPNQLPCVAALKVN